MVVSAGTRLWRVLFHAALVCDDRRDVGDRTTGFARVARYVSEGRAANRDLVPLTDEWRMTQDYAALESLRLGPRLTGRFSFGDDLDGVEIPALSLQPLVENAIRHGIAPRPGAGAVDISVSLVDRFVQVGVRDDGLGRRAATRGSGTASISCAAGWKHISAMP